MNMKKLSALFIFALAALTMSCGSDKKYSGHMGGCCCCCGGGSGSGQKGGSGGNASTSDFRGFGQPTTYITTSSLTDAPNGNVSFTIDPGSNPAGGGISYAQVIAFTAVGSLTSTFNPRARVWQLDAATSAKIEPPIATIPPGGIYTIGAFSGAARKYAVEVYRKLNPTPTTYFDTRVNYYADIEPGEVQVAYSCSEGSALLNIDD